MATGSVSQLGLRLTAGALRLRPLTGPGRFPKATGSPSRKRGPPITRTGRPTGRRSISLPTEMDIRAFGGSGSKRHLTGLKGSRLRCSTFTGARTLITEVGRRLAAESPLRLSKQEGPSGRYRGPGVASSRHFHGRGSLPPGILVLPIRWRREQRIRGPEYGIIRRHLYSGPLFSVSCTRGGNGPVERAGSHERHHVSQTLHGKAPLGSRESTCPTGNGVNFCDVDDIGVSRPFNRSHNCRIDAVSIGRDTVTGPC